MHGTALRKIELFFYFVVVVVFIFVVVLWDWGFLISLQEQLIDMCFTL